MARVTKVGLAAENTALRKERNTLLEYLYASRRGAPQFTETAEVEFPGPCKTRETHTLELYGTDRAAGGVLCHSIEPSGAVEVVFFEEALVNWNKGVVPCGLRAALARLAEKVRKAYVDALEVK